MQAFAGVLSGIALGIEMVGALVIAGYLLAALLTLARTRSVARARLLVVEGTLYGLSFKVAASLLKTILLHTWQQIAIFAAILAIRTIVKLVLTWERGEIRLTLPYRLGMPRGGTSA